MIVGAGAVGIEAAINLKKKGKDVTVIEMQPDLSSLMASSGGATMEFMEMIDELKIPLKLNCKLEEVCDNSVICRDTKTDEKTELDADTVLLAIGVTPCHETADRLRHSAPETECFVVGDASETGNIGPAVKSAFRAAAYI